MSALKTLAIAALLCGGAPLAQAALLNGGFEDPVPLDNWSLTDDSGWSAPQLSGNPPAATGHEMMVLGYDYFFGSNTPPAHPDGTASLAQTFSLSAPTTTISFALRLDSGTRAGTLSAYFNNAQLGSWAPGDLSDAKWLTFSYSAVTTPSNTIEFWVDGALENISSWLIDDVQATDVAVPEPASMALLGVGLIGLAAAARRRRG